tara:strand:+ start:53 stop:595 length:543 start_codon:yes stop_codon:yes gene_type:complete
MANNLQEFISSMGRAKGFARLTRYEVEIFPPSGMSGFSGPSRDIALHCDTIQMPGHDLKTQDVKYGSAPVKKMVTAHGYAGKCAATFYLDAHLETKSYFEYWQQLAVNLVTHKAQYYDNYAKASMKIFQLVGNSRTYGVELEEVYPETIGQIEYTFAGEGVATLSVGFNYRKWHTLDSLE